MDAAHLARKQAQDQHREYLRTLGGPDPDGRNTLFNAMKTSQVLGISDKHSYKEAAAIGARLEPLISTEDAFSICASAWLNLDLPLAPDRACGYVSSKFSDVNASAPEWFWEGRIPKSMFSLLEVDISAESVLLVATLAAGVSRGQSIRSGESITQAEVAFVVADDMAADTYRPLLERLGADLPKIHLLSRAVTEGSEVEFDLATHCQNLAVFFRDNPAVELMIIDPLETHVGARDKGSLRTSLLALARIAKEHGVAIVGVCDARSAVAKDATKVARMVWGLREDPCVLDRRILYPVKRGLGNAPAVAWRLENGSIEWEDGSVEDPNQVLRGKSARPRQREGDWLLAKLADGPRRMTELLDEGIACKFKPRTLERAKKDLNLSSVKMGDAWFWQLPAARS